MASIFSAVTKKEQKMSMKFSDKEFTNFKMHILRCGTADAREGSNY